MNEKSIFVVGGGPSLKGFDFSKLENLTTIAVNSALVDVPNPNYFITSCPGYCRTVIKNDFYNKEVHSVMVINPLNQRFFEVKLHLSKFSEWVIPSRYDGQLGFTWEQFATGGNSGFAALQYVILSGYKNIYLLGIDVRTDKGIHYHHRYPTMINEVTWWYECFLQGLDLLKKDTDIKVYSCSNISLLNEVIPFVKFEEIK